MKESCGFLAGIGAGLTLAILIVLSVSTVGSRVPTITILGANVKLATSPSNDSASSPVTTQAIPQASGLNRAGMQGALGSTISDALNIVTIAVALVLGFVVYQMSTRHVESS